MSVCVCMCVRACVRVGGWVWLTRDILNNIKINNLDRWFYFKTYNKYNECIMTLKAENITSYAVYSRHLYRLGLIHKHLNMLSVRCFSHLKSILAPRLLVSTITTPSNCEISWMDGCLAILRPFQQYFSHIRTIGG